MTGVSQILAQLAENAGKARLVQGQIYGNAVAAASQIPAQILDDQERQQQIDFQRARDVQQMGLALRADQRATADQAYQDTTRAQQLEQDRIVNAGLAAAMGPDGDPSRFDSKVAAATVARLGRPELIYAVIAKHRDIQGKPIFKKDDEAGIDPNTFQPIPGLEAQPKMPEMGTPAYENAVAIRNLTNPPGAPASSATPPPGAPPPGAGVPTYAGRLDALAAPPASTVPPGGPGAPATVAPPPIVPPPTRPPADVPAFDAGGTFTGPTTYGPAPASIAPPILTPPAAAPPTRPLTMAEATAKVYADQRAAAAAAKDPVAALYTKRASGATLTPDETAQIAGYEAKKNADDAPVTVKTIENGKLVEKVMTRAQALAAGSFPSQPPASVQIQNMPPPAARPPSKADIAIANYQVGPPSPRTFATPAGQAMLERILAVNPDYDASLFSVRAPTRKAYTTGPQGQQFVAMNTAIEHLDQLQAAADALKNGTFKPGNAAYNAMADLFGSGAPTSFATIKEKVDKELDAVASKGVPTVSGAAAQKAIGGVSSSPESVGNYIDTSIRLLGSSQNALRLPYHQAMGANAPFDPLTPEAKAVLLKRGFDPENPTATVTPPAALAPNRTQRVQQNGVTYDVTTDATGKVVSSKAVP